MATKHTLTITEFATLAGIPHLKNVRPYVVTNLPADEALIDTTTNEIMAGGESIKLTNGSGSIDLPATDATDLNVVANTVQYEVRAEYVDPATRGRKTWRSGYFALTADANLADVATDASPMAVASAAQYALEAQEARDEAITITGISTTDSAVAALVSTPAGPLTQSALSTAVGTELGTNGSPARTAADARYARVNPSAYPTALPAVAYIAHRGGAGMAPEETMEAFRASAALGAHGIEADCQPLADGALALIHDTTVDRTTDGTGNVSGFTTPAYRALNAAAKFPPWNSKSVPPALLNELLAELGGKLVLFIEPKDSSNATQVMDAVEAYGLKSYVVLEASDPTIHAQLKARGFATYFWNGGTISSLTNWSNAVTAGADFLGFDGTITANDSFVPAMVALGKPVIPFTVNRRNRRDALLALGVKGFLTDQPSYLRGTTAQRTIDSWRQGVLGHGYNVSATGQGNPTITSGVISIPGSSNQYATIGEVSPIANAAGTYTIDIDVALSDVSSGAVAIAITPDDQAYNMATGSYPNGWLFYIRNTGVMTVFKCTNPSTATGVGDSTARATSALVANTMIHLRVQVTPTTLVFTRTDSGGYTPITVTDSTQRGGYLLVGKTGVGGSAKAQNLAIT